jgi:asparagine synthase (glutamine-hydrolysing)
MTMAASIEARMPFMDTKLAEFVAGLPDSMRIRGLTSKYILRRAMRDILPSVILNRPKVGFRVPVDQWFRGPMRAYLRDHLDSPSSLTRQLYVREELSRILDEHERGQHNHEKLLWSLLNLELFQRRYRLSASDRSQDGRMAAS